MWHDVLTSATVGGTRMTSHYIYTLNYHTLRVLENRKLGPEVIYVIMVISLSQ